MEERSWFMSITSLESLEFLVESVAFTVSSVTVPVITLCPWCPCNKMMINDREEDESWTVYICVCV